MSEQYYERYCTLLTKIQADAELCHLIHRLNSESAALNQLLHRLSPEDQTIITEHLGICAEINERILELVAIST